MNGKIVGQKVKGQPASARVDYVTDALGSVVATADQTGAVVNYYNYKPYGQNAVKSRLLRVPLAAYPCLQNELSTRENKMKSLICFCILVSFVLLDCKIGGKARAAGGSKARSEFVSAPLREIDGRKLCVVIPNNWKIVPGATNPGSESLKPLCHFGLTRRTGKAVERVHLALYVNPAFSGGSFVGHFPAGTSLTTYQGYHGVINRYFESKSIKNRFTFDCADASHTEADVLYPDGFLYCNIYTSHMTETETERLATYIFRNLRLER